MGKVARDAQLTAPEPLTDRHDTSNFACVHDSLTTWLRKRALANAASGASRTYAACDDRLQVVGYYALAAGSIVSEATPGRVRRNMPDPVPVIVLGRLAVHRDYAGRGIGRGLLKDAISRSIQAAGVIGVRALVCHAIDEQAKAFYKKFGFVESPIHELTVVIGLPVVI